jgi:hypothetical protein
MDPGLLSEVLKHTTIVAALVILAYIVAALLKG